MSTQTLILSLGILFAWATSQVKTLKGFTSQVDLLL